MLPSTVIFPSLKAFNHNSVEIISKTVTWKNVDSFSVCTFIFKSGKNYGLDWPELNNRSWITTELWPNKCLCYHKSLKVKGFHFQQWLFRPHQSNKVDIINNSIWQKKNTWKRRQTKFITLKLFAIFHIILEYLFIYCYIFHNSFRLNNFKEVIINILKINSYVSINGNVHSCC